MPRRVKLTDEMRQVLGILVSCPDGATLPELLRMHGCNAQAIGQCLDQKFARSQREAQRSDLMRFWITQAGQDALAF